MLFLVGPERQPSSLPDKGRFAGDVRDCLSLRRQLAPLRAGAHDPQMSGSDGALQRRAPAIQWQAPEIPVTRLKSQKCLAA